MIGTDCLLERLVAAFLQSEGRAFEPCDERGVFAIPDRDLWMYVVDRGESLLFFGHPAQVDFDDGACMQPDDEDDGEEETELAADEHGEWMLSRAWISGLYTIWIEVTVSGVDDDAFGCIVRRFRERLAFWDACLSASVPSGDLRHMMLPLI